jgi:hypothetical protein
MVVVKPKFGPVIAERRLLVDGARAKTLKVSLGTPRPYDDDEWECPFRIKGSGIDTVEYGRGVDSMQALVTALDGIRAMLDETGLSLSWQDALPDHTGFQRAIPVLFGAAFAKRLERLVDREIKLYVQNLKRTRRQRPATRGARRAAPLRSPRSRRP